MSQEGSSQDARSLVPPPSPRRLWLKIPLATVGFLLFFELSYLAWNWIVPPWGDMREGKIPASALIKDYIAKREDDPKLPPLNWKPITKQVPKSVSKVFIYAEDSRFYEHDGFDWDAIQAAAKYNWKKGKVVRGASTISQQTAKNLFLSLSRSPIRKWHEILLTYMLEAKLTKPQILHAYLNIAEFGVGIYGIEAAAQTYFHKSAANLSTGEAVQLAASLPSPKKNNPRTRTRSFVRNERRVGAAVHLVEQYAAEGKKAGSETSALPTSEEIAAKLREVTAGDDNSGKDDEDDNDDDDTPAAGATPASPKAQEVPAPAAAPAPAPVDAAPVGIPPPTESQPEAGSTPP